MKRLLIILLLFPLISFSQKDTIHGFSDVTTFRGSGISIDYFYQTNRDTTKVIILVCDTAFTKYVNNYYIAISPEDTVGHVKNRIPDVWWQFGYEVKTQTVSSGGWYKTTVEYLDENKKPLRKSIIVWQSKQIE